MGCAAGGISVGSVDSVAIMGGAEGPESFVDRLPHNSRKNPKNWTTFGERSPQGRSSFPNRLYGTIPSQALVARNECCAQGERGGDDQSVRGVAVRKAR